MKSKIKKNDIVFNWFDDAAAPSKKPTAWGVAAKDEYTNYNGDAVIDLFLVASDWYDESCHETGWDARFWYRASEEPEHAA